MRAVVQRVKEASVSVEGTMVSSIGPGLVVFLGVGLSDTEADVDYLVSKIATLRVFEDVSGKMNLALQEVKGEMLVISQFTLYGDCRKGRRPSFTSAMNSFEAKRLYEQFVERSRSGGIAAKGGVFQAMMAVSLVNDGPVTLLLDSQKLF